MDNLLTTLLLLDEQQRLVIQTLADYLYQLKKGAKQPDLHIHNKPEIKVRLKDDYVPPEVMFKGKRKAKPAPKPKRKKRHNTGLPTVTNRNVAGKGEHLSILKQMVAAYGKGVVHSDLRQTGMSKPTAVLSHLFNAGYLVRQRVKGNGPHGPRFMYDLKPRTYRLLLKEVDKQ